MGELERTKVFFRLKRDFFSWKIQGENMIYLILMEGFFMILWIYEEMLKDLQKSVFANLFKNDSNIEWLKLLDGLNSGFNSQ
jgi:hypothetical protein